MGENKECIQLERLRKLENNSTLLNERLDNLIKKMDRWANVTIGLILTVVSGIMVTVLGGLILAITLYYLDV